MTEPLSIAASVAGLISLGIQVTQSLVDFYTKYKSQDSELARIIERLESLVETFQHLEKALSGHSFPANERGLVERIEKTITACNELVRELQDECQKFNQTSATGAKAAIKNAGRRIKYPFRQSTLQKLDEDISEIRANLSLMLDVLQLQTSQRYGDDVFEMKALLELVQAKQISSDIRIWLGAPDATAEHNAACGKKHPGTGMWLIKSSQFSNWLTEGNSVAWLKGFAGSGKSVLCSTAIQSALRHRGYDPGIGIAFFYFTFDDNSKQDESSMIRALLLQLSNQLQDDHADLMQLHETYKPGQPSSKVLLEYLRRLIQRFRHTYIFLDALDESPRNGPREHVLDVLEIMHEWDMQQLHLFVTSRDEPDIRDLFDHFSTQQMVMRNSGIDEDIVNFISGRLNEDRRLRKLSPYHNKIQEALAKRAGGVFRWVECQLRSLQSCPRSEYHLDKVLDSLPHSLDETYERMLCNIESHLIDDARRILTLLCFAARPMTVSELIDGIAVDIEGSIGLNTKRRLQGFDDIYEMCLGFVDINLHADSTNEIRKNEDMTSIVRIAHFSIQEYLESERIQHQRAAMFSLNSVTAHAEIAQICLVYLLEDGLFGSTLEQDLDQFLIEKFPLARFAAEYWYRHYKGSTGPVPKLDRLATQLFQSQNSFATWVKLHDVDAGGYVDWRDATGNPIYYASLLGLDRVLPYLVDEPHAGSVDMSNVSSVCWSTVLQQIDAPCGRWGTALHAASGNGHVHIVRMLFEKKADVNALDDDHRTPLHEAPDSGHDQIVRMLLEKKADVNALDYHHRTPLHEASRHGHDQIVRMLFEKGTDVNVQDYLGQTPLHEASEYGHDQIMRILFEKGADVNVQNDSGQTSLHMASKSGHDQIMRMLLEKGADVNTRCYYGQTSLHEASKNGQDQIVRILLEKGVDVNIQDKYHRTALHWASKRGHDQIMRMLLEKGTDVNTRNYFGQTSLHEASTNGHDQIVRILLEKGVDVNIQDKYHRTALHWASKRGHDQIMRMLIDNGAHVTEIPEIASDDGSWMEWQRAMSKRMATRSKSKIRTRTR